jgi:hypothetical protein
MVTSKKIRCFIKELSLKVKVFSVVLVVHGYYFLPLYLLLADGKTTQQKNLLIAAVSFDTVNTDCIRNR